MGTIHFFSEDVDFSPEHPRKKATWIKSILALEKVELGELNFIFCSDRFLLQLNKQYLHHNTYTDIITFDNANSPKQIAGDIYISIERVLDNAKRFKVSALDELDRVIIHGVLHLMGYNDKKPQEKAQMRKKEEACLSLRE
ncbi:MAG: rRNA maturation RNase YbeY [Cyclobacteriaceae bacterium]|nr:rRNA maturation RNase YbeY [Cyclobacteriaceae bacterium]